MNVRANEMVQQAKALAGRLDDLSWILKSQREESTNSRRLSSDLHKHAIALTHMHSHTHNNNNLKMGQ